MVFGKTKLELKAGIFVFIGLVILSVFVLSIRGFKTWTSGYDLNFVFNFVNGVKIGAPVRFCGVDVGEVKSINIHTQPNDGKPKVRISCRLKKNVQIPVDSTVWVNTLGLLGEKYIEIMPGQNYANYVAADQELTGEDPVPMHEITTLAKRIVSDIDTCIVKIKNKEGTLGKLLYDDKIYNELDALVTDIRKHPWKLFFKTKEQPPEKKKQ